MNDYTVFYSWQTDSPQQCNKTFIRESLDTARKYLGGDIRVHDSEREESLIEGVAGTPEMPTTMFDKIGESAIYVGDVSLVGRGDITRNTRVKKFMNSNVALEMGYAAGRLGWGRVICIANEYFGRCEEQPFFVRNRCFPIGYSLSPEQAGRSKGEKIKAELAERITKAILVVDANDGRKIDGMIEVLDIFGHHLIHIFHRTDPFAEPDEKDKAWNMDQYSGAIQLLAAGIIKADFIDGKRTYHWTNFGKMVLKKLAQEGGM